MSEAIVIVGYVSTKYNFSSVKVSRFGSNLSISSLNMSRIL